MQNKLKSLINKNTYKLDLQTSLSDDWIIQNLDSKPYFQSLKLNSKIEISKTEILKIIGTLTNTINKPNMLIINGTYGFINDIFYEEINYIELKTFIEDRLSLTNIKKKDLIIGNLYERPDGSRFIFLGIKYLICKIEKVIHKDNTFHKSLSNLKTKYYLLDLRDSFISLEELTNKNLVIFKDLGNNNLVSNIELNDFLIKSLENNKNILKIYDDKKISSIKYIIKEFPYDKENKEELKLSKNLIISADGSFYKFLETKEIHQNERVSGRASSSVYFKYDLYQKISIIDNEIVYFPKLKHDFLGTNSWYGNSSYTFDDNFSLKNKRLCSKSDTFKHIDTSKLYTIDLI